MTEPRPGSVRFLLAGVYRRLSYVACGDPAAPPVLCVHGLTRTGRDFDALAAALADRFHVIAPDLPGRGRSEWLGASDLYTLDSYVVALSHLMAGLGTVDVVGTSLGGICGMAIAAMPGNAVRRLVLNDIGPLVPAAALARIRAYITAPAPGFADLDEAERYFRRVHAPFGALGAAGWRHLAVHSVRNAADGTLVLHYDPALATAVAAGPVGDSDMWAAWNAITAPRLTLRGAFSDVLLPQTLAQMAARSETYTVPGCGHAPALMDAPTIAVVREFLGRR